MRAATRKDGLLIAILVGWTAALVLLAWQIVRQAGHMAYGLDDAYIHLAIAKHLVQDGVWGVTPFAFSSSSSSILWPLILAGAFRVFGVREIVPLVINIPTSFALLGVLYACSRRLSLSALQTAGVAVAVLFLTPIPPLVFNGMETLLQIVLSLALAERLVRHVTQSKPSDAVALTLLAGALTSVRYEGLFLVAVACALLLMRREFRLAAFIAFAGALPPLAYGWVSALQGWSVLPNSLLLKGATLSLAQPKTLLQAVIRPFGTIDDTLSGGQIPRWQPLVVLVLLIALWRLHLGARKVLSDSRLVPAFFFCGVAGLHMALISSEWFFRYGAYLSVLGIWALVCLLEGVSFARGPQTVGVGLVGATVGLLVLYPSLRAGLLGSGETILASRNIHEQQEQMGLFLASYYTGQAVAANDIGAIDFYADLRTVDLWGLASRNVARAKREGTYDWEAVDAVTRESHAKIAVVYDNWFVPGGRLPPSWVKVAEWTIPGNVVCGGDTVSWYALEEDEVSPLAAHLLEFAPRLPKEVRVREYRPG